jgi:hypothetical protein
MVFYPMRATCLARIALTFLDLLIRIIFGMDWINVAGDRDSGGQLLSESWGFIKCGELLDCLRNC